MNFREVAHHVPLHHELYVVGLTLLGRNRVGLVRALWENGAYRRRHEATMESLKAQSRVLDRADGLVLVETPFGDFWIPEGTDLFSPLAERAIDLYTSSADHTVRPGDIVLDCGANVGVFVGAALERDAAKVVAVEPSPPNIECLRRNFAKEIADGRVIVVDEGLWDREETLRYLVMDNSLLDSSVRATGDTPQILNLRVTTIDRLCRRLNLPRVDFIKMDIEGAEQRAVAGARETLARHHPRLSLASYHQPDDFEVIPRIVRDSWPEVRVHHGPCTSTFGHVQPETLYFSS